MMATTTASDARTAPITPESAVTPHGVAAGRTEPLSRSDTDWRCDVWGGAPENHQIEARDVVGLVPPFAWVVARCPNRMCVRRDHLVVRQPLQLGYLNGVCIYCGLLASTMDHLLPEPFTGAAARVHVVTVPACHDCNSSLGDVFAPNVTERRRLVHQRIRRRSAKWLRVRPFTETELAEFGPILRSKIRQGVEMRALTEARLNWPADGLYDIKAFQDAGIEDPFVLGLLGPAATPIATTAVVEQPEDVAPEPEPEPPPEPKPEPKPEPEPEPELKPPPARAARSTSKRRVRPAKRTTRKAKPRVSTPAPVSKRTTPVGYVETAETGDIIKRRSTGYRLQVCHIRPDGGLRSRALNTGAMWTLWPGEYAVVARAVTTDA